MNEPASNRLTRSLRERDLLYLFVGSVIGSGIFLTPGLILRQLGGSVGYSLLVWLLGGVLSLLGALSYAELAAANASRITGATGSTGVPTDRSTMPSGWAPASAFASAKVSQGNSGRDANTAGRPTPGLCSTGRLSRRLRPVAADP